MKHSLSSRRMNRRQFLISGSAALAGLALACGKSTDTTAAFKSATAANVESSLVPSVAKPIIQATRPPLSAPQGAADLILTNGKVFTVDHNNTIAQAVAIKDGLIQAVGKSGEIEQLTGEATKVLDLGGRGVTPGMIDPHIHYRLIGLMTNYYTPLMPPEVTSIATMQQALTRVIAKKKPGDWVMPYYLVLADNMYPTRADLDPVSPDNPVFIQHIGGHWGAANSAALKIANVTASTQSPPGGIIAKDASGQPTGALYNHRAMDVVRRYAPPISDELMRQSILDSQAQMAACGITTVQDNNIRSLDDIKAYQDLTRSGEFYLRNNLFLTLEWPQDIEKLGQVEFLQEGNTRFSGFKFLIDGQMPTAFCHEPHNGTAWNVSTWEPQNFKDTVRTLHDTGLQIAVHCFGDAAVDLTLDAYEAAMNANPRPDPRHRLEHVIITTPESTPRIKDLGVVVSTNPHFIYIAGDSYEPIFGPERAKRAMVTREWLENGIHMTIGSDAPTTPWYTPQTVMAGAMLRPTLSKKILNKEQCLTFEESLRAQTFEAAYATHQENELGSLEAGKLADVVVWPGDPSSLGPAELVEMDQMDLTLIGGKVVHGQV